MVAAMVPDVRDVRLPMTTGEAGKEPFASLNWARNTLPELKLAETVYGTFIVLPAQNGLPLMVPVVMVCDSTRIQILNTVKMMILKVLISERFEWSKYGREVLFGGHSDSIQIYQILIYLYRINFIKKCRFNRVIFPGL
jgi:hypothetical protein